MSVLNNATFRFVAFAFGAVLATKFGADPQTGAMIGAASQTLGNIFVNLSSTFAEKSAQEQFRDPIINHHIARVTSATVQAAWIGKYPTHRAPENNDFEREFLNTISKKFECLSSVEGAAKLFVSKDNFSDALLSSPLDMDEWHGILEELQSVLDSGGTVQPGELREVARTLKDNYVYLFLEQLVKGNAISEAAKEKINLFIGAQNLTILPEVKATLESVQKEIQKLLKLQEGIDLLVRRSNEDNEIPNYRLGMPQAVLHSGSRELFSGRCPITSYQRPKEAWEKVMAFVKNPRPGVKYALISGDGGIGKSRLAAELVRELAATDDTWHAVIVMSTPQNPFNWNSWDIPGNTLLVFDYGHGDQKVIEAALSALTNKHLDCAVRLLLLDRTATTSILSTALSKFSTYQHRFPEGEYVLKMPELTKDQLETTFLEMYDWTRAYFNLPTSMIDRRDKNLLKPLENAGMLTPLYVMMAGYARAHGAQHDFLSPAELIKFVIQQEWQRVDEHYPGLTDYRGQLLLWYAAATALGPLSYKEFKKLPGSQFEPQNWDCADGERARRSLFTLFGTCEDFTCQPVKPDIIGETLVAALLAYDSDKNAKELIDGVGILNAANLSKCLKKVIRAAVA